MYSCDYSVLSDYVQPERMAKQGAKPDQGRGLSGELGSGWELNGALHSAEGLWVPYTQAAGEPSLMHGDDSIENYPVPAAASSKKESRSHQESRGYHPLSDTPEPADGIRTPSEDFPGTNCPQRTMGRCHKSDKISLPLERRKLLCGVGQNEIV